MTPRKSVLILGATSDIARATARRHGARGDALILAGRDSHRLADEAADLRLRFGVPVEIRLLDVLEPDSFAAFVDGLPVLPDVVICAVGLLGDQTAAERTPVLADRIIRSNFTGPAAVLALVADAMAARGAGVVVGISSVAGDRGRAANYVYGSAKAGFTAYLSGLGGRMAQHGVRVVTVRPGFVRTRMTEGLRLPPLLTATPDEVARAILRAEAGGRADIYVRPIWRFIMAVIRSLPDSLFRRISS
ncbi:SDR family oxidoreductase [Azospirillum sp. B506]|uniref:SDR family oxidoreductase n=1 Tax=Azospirillum sp. B506 TaxID=137721 RepID=UPI00034927D2|nr:SDR family oxidoreductase [Azospirillum sp. B506]